MNDVLSKETDFSAKDASTEPNGTSIAKGDLQVFMREVSEDGGAFRIIRNSQMAIIVEDIQGLEREDFEGDAERAKSVSRTSGQVMGTLNYIHSDVLGSDRDDKISQNNWNKTYKYHGLGALVTEIPILGDSMQRLVDVETGKEVEDMNKEVADKTTDELVKYYREKGYPSLSAALQERAIQVGLPKDYIYGDEEGFNSIVAPSAKTSYGDAVDDTRNAIGKMAP
ncbi:hypothetical protein ACG5V6_21580 [Streptomyces chitinivorans]|uniref:Uncharacterized protein n=1 Tax=Streptomyces chitinivorans TaxID=1257027 RepID=A0ABW7HY14_9ACTN|nr:hypothetical protein [Streptomyces chitinivorans]MDH2412127.1 hypothetical protein [Streptomyces chitinivorans]